MRRDAKLVIRRETGRPPADAVAAFDGQSTGPIVDAMGRRGALSPSIRPVTRATRFCGPALTVWTAPRDNLAPYAALAFAKPGDVLAIQTGGPDAVAVLGDIAIGMARNAGIVAIVTDGYVRDREGLDSLGIPVFATGLTPDSPFKNGPGEVNGTIALGGVAMEPGDILVGDPDGIAVVPWRDAARIRGALDTVLAKEADMERVVASGAKRPAWLDAALEGEGVVYVD
ncbi:MAG: diguanylate cyclase [Acuticoccus sp.]